MSSKQKLAALAKRNIKLGLSLLVWKKSPIFEEKACKSVIHQFTVKGHQGLTINPYQGCGHRCGYCYVSYEWSPEFFNRIYAKSNVAGVLE
jgi:DNA repair photolyase